MNLKPSICIDALFEGTPTAEAIALVAKLGYPAFEFWMWWEKDLPQVMQARDAHSLKIAACCTKFVSLVDAQVRDLYLEGLQESIAAAKQLDCPVLISQVGDFLPEVDLEDQHDSLVAGLKAAAKMLEGTNITLAIEPLNEQVDHAGYYLVESDEAFEIVEKVASPNVKVTFDIYHQQISEGHLIHNITSNIEKIAHFHAAGNPGRHELNLGEIHYPAIIEAIQKTDYDGYFGLEYWPEADAETGLLEAKLLF
ncbi:TIM barrel protein [Aureliella helgolandensis]|uniref:Hydroxypyruvate isomerase n=1 Tax=Aureliella helgolandensis TaxID=2527968 RepID=A0A518GDK7_9BACT|nr:TIM barrel protein [Aureliella helgolandensis]QDV26694.1 Hydroxypyruvate isomerase [Aureliella helgolandensis]